MSLLEKNINEFEDFVREVFKEEKSSDLSLAIDSYHHFIDKIKSIQNPNKIIIPFEVFNSFYQSLDKNQDLKFFPSYLSRFQRNACGHFEL